jgi:DNA-binding NarL/FixJ family response regulator
VALYADVGAGIDEAVDAARLHLSAKTVGHHVSDALRKLRLASRRRLLTPTGSGSREGEESPER